MSVFGFVLRTTLFGLLVVSPILLAAAVGTEAPETLTEVEQLKLQLAQETQRRISAQYAAAMAQCVAQPNVRPLLDESDKANSAAGALIESFFAAHKVDKVKFRLDPATGKFMPTVPPAQ